MENTKINLPIDFKKHFIPVEGLNTLNLRSFLEGHVYSRTFKTHPTKFSNMKQFNKTEELLFQVAQQARLNPHLSIEAIVDSSFPTRPDSLTDTRQLVVTPEQETLIKQIAYSRPGSHWEPSEFYSFDQINWFKLNTIDDTNTTQSNSGKASIGHTGLFKTDTPNIYEISTITDVQMVYHTESGSSYFEEDLKGLFEKYPEAEEWLVRNKLHKTE